MSSVRKPLETVEPTDEHDDRTLEQVGCWPRTRLVSWSLMLALCAAILAPVAIARGHGLDWLAMLLPAFVAALGARALFEALSFGARFQSTARHLVAAFPAAALTALLVAAVSLVVGLGFSVLAGVLTASFGLVVLTSAGALRDLEIRVRLSMRRVYFVGTAATRRDLERELARRHDASLAGAAGINAPADGLVPAVIDAAATVLVLDRDAMVDAAIVDAAAQLNLVGLHVRDLVSYYESEFKKVPLGELSPTWFLFDIAPIHRRLAYRIARRSLEVALAAVVLMLSLPVLIVAVVAIKLTSRGPVLYRQRRVGKGGAEFMLVKLRTMRLADDPTAGWAASHADRITRVGRFLRRFRLDELPQLWSVIRGDLALIGPRPEQVPIAERLERDLPHYSARHCIRPGITGWAQVNIGYAGSVEGTIAKLQRDLYYIKHSSLRLDGLILWLTFKTVIAGRG